MARRTLNDFDAELLVRLANRTDITPVMRSFLLNDAMFKVGIMYEHSQLQKTSIESQLIGTDTFDIAGGDLWWVEHMWNMTDNRTVTLGDMDKIEAMIKRTAPPMQYFTRASSIFLDSLSNTAKQHRVFYVKKPAQWTVATDPAPSFVTPSLKYSLLVAPLAFPSWSFQNQSLGLGSLSTANPSTIPSPSRSLVVVPLPSNPRFTWAPSSSPSKKDLPVSSIARPR